MLFFKLPIVISYAPLTAYPIVEHNNTIWYNYFMKYDFCTLTDRLSQNSIKWEQMNAKNPQAVKNGIVPLSIADMEFKTPPELIEGIKEFANNLIMGYTQSSSAFYDALLSWQARRHNYFPAKESIVNTFGVVHALFAAVRAFTNERDGVVLMPPVYGPFFMAVERNNRKLLECPLINSENKWEMDFAKLELIFKTEKPKLLLFCSPHNPVGRVWTKLELERLADLCVTYNVLLVSDEIHNDIIMSGYKHTVIETVNSKIADNCIVCTSCAKTFNIAGVPLSSIFIKNKTLREKFQSELDRMPGNVSSCFGFKLNEIAYTECENWLDQCIKQIEINAALFKNQIHKNLPQVNIPVLEGTYLMWLDFRSFNFEQAKLKTLLEEKALLFFTDGLFFGNAKGFMRINLAAPQFVIEAAAQRLIKVFTDSAL